MVIETERLYLRQLTMDDLDLLYPILSDPLAMTHYPAPFSLEKTEQWILWNLKNYETYGFGLWAVLLKEGDIFLGDCGITMQNINGEAKPEIGYHIDRCYQQQGYGTEAAAGCMKVAFEVLKLAEIYSYMKYTNSPSQRVAQKNGMSFRFEYAEEKNEITRVYSITADEYYKMHGCERN